MTQLTIRSNSKELDARLTELAAERGCSLNQAANFLLREGANLLDEPPQTGIGKDLDEFVGSWSAAEAQAFDQRIADACESIEEDLWQ